MSKAVTKPDSNLKHHSYSSCITLNFHDNDGWHWLLMNRFRKTNKPAINFISLLWIVGASSKQGALGTLHKLGTTAIARTYQLNVNLKKSYPRLQSLYFKITNNLKITIQARGIYVHRCWWILLHLQQPNILQIWISNKRLNSKITSADDADLFYRSSQRKTFSLKAWI